MATVIPFPGPAALRSRLVERAVEEARAEREAEMREREMQIMRGICPRRLRVVR